MLIIKKTLLILMMLISLNSLACDHIFIDRKDLSSITNVDLDILDEYTLEQPVVIKNVPLLTLITSVVPKLNFTVNPNMNKLIQNHLLKNISLFKVFPIKNLKHPYRNGFLVQNALNEDLVYSFIIYIPSDCAID